MPMSAVTNTTLLLPLSTIKALLKRRVWIPAAVCSKFAYPIWNEDIPLTSLVYGIVSANCKQRKNEDSLSQILSRCLVINAITDSFQVLLNVGCSISGHISMTMICEHTRDATSVMQEACMTFCEIVKKIQK